MLQLRPADRRCSLRARAALVHRQSPFRTVVAERGSVAIVQREQALGPEKREQALGPDNHRGRAPASPDTKAEEQTSAHQRTRNCQPSNVSRLGHTVQQ